MHVILKRDLKTGRLTHLGYYKNATSRLYRQFKNTAAFSYIIQLVTETNKRQIEKNILAWNSKITVPAKTA